MPSPADRPTRAPYSYRADPAVPAFADDKPVIIFDGHCAMCSGFARFVLRHDTAARFRLLPAQTDLGRALFVHYGYAPDDYETNLLLEDGRAYVKLETALRIVPHFGFPWTLVPAFRVLPVRFRDALYDVIARNRYRIWGRREVCYRSDPAHLERFLP